MRQRLKRRATSSPAETPTAFLLLQNLETNFQNFEKHTKKQHQPRSFLFKILTVALLTLCYILAVDHLSRCPWTVSAQLQQTPILTNSKIFHHNRTTPAVVAMALAQQKKNGNHEKTEKSPPKVKGHPVKRPKVNQGQPQNLNINNYFKTAINILSMGLGAVTTPKSIQSSWSPRFPPNPSVLSNVLPSMTTSTVHPLSVLRLSNSTIQSHRKINSSNVEGRSALDFEPLFEASYDDKNETGKAGSGKRLESSFFQKFEDWNDPVAQESAPPSSFTVVDPPNLNFHRGNAPPLSVGRPVTLPGRPPVQWSPQGHSSGNGPSGSESYVNQKHVSYWPNKLNSYYGIQKPNLPRRPSAPASSGFDYPGGSSYPDSHQFEEHYDLGASSSSVESEIAIPEKTIMDRVSIFYTNYKLLAWGIIVVAAAVVAVGAVVGLYLNNPPTEVVTAKRELQRALNDPKLLTFLESLLSNSDSNSSVLSSPLRSRNSKERQRMRRS